MRIIAGKFRGSRLSAPKGLATRPTTGRVRETLFNVLSNHIEFEHLRVLDLFAGTGALGIESLSRGADYCLFVEQASGPVATIRQNIEHLDLGKNSSITKRDATKLGLPADGLCFDLAFADPPYGRGLGERAAVCLTNGGWLAPGALLVLEEGKGSFPEKLNGFDRIDLRHFGETSIGLFKSKL